MGNGFHKVIGNHLFSQKIGRLDSFFKILYFKYNGAGYQCILILSERSDYEPKLSILSYYF